MEKATFIKGSKVSIAFIIVLTLAIIPHTKGIKKQEIIDKKPVDQTDIPLKQEFAKKIDPFKINIDPQTINNWIEKNKDYLIRKYPNFNQLGATEVVLLELERYKIQTEVTRLESDNQKKITQLNMMQNKKWMVNFYRKMMSTLPPNLRGQKYSDTTLINSFDISDIVDYIVKPGETVEMIAYGYGIAPELINQWNVKDLDFDDYKAGDKILIMQISWKSWLKVINENLLAAHNYKNFSEELKKQLKKNPKILRENLWCNKNWFQRWYQTNVINSVAEKFRGKDKHIVVDDFDVIAIKEHTVKKGETLKSIALSYNADSWMLKLWNKRNFSRNPLKPGEKITVKHLYWKISTCFASYYGHRNEKLDSFHGEKMSNGEQYNKWGFTIAHRYLPLGLELVIINEKTGDKLGKILVKDRGPFAIDKNGFYTRDVDMSLGVAYNLYAEKAGVIKVKIIPKNV